MSKDVPQGEGLAPESVILSAEWLAEFEQRKAPNLNINGTDYNDSSDCGNWIGILKTERNAICAALRATPLPAAEVMAEGKPDVNVPLLIAIATVVIMLFVLAMTTVIVNRLIRIEAAIQPCTQQEGR